MQSETTRKEWRYARQRGVNVYRVKGCSDDELEYASLPNWMRNAHFDRPVGKAIYAIEAFPDDAQLWRIDWIGGVAYNASVPSEPLIGVCLARLPKGETNPVSARSRSSETKFVAKIGVGLLPFISTASVWQKGRPVATHCAAYRRQLTIDTKSCRTEMLGDLTANYNGIPRSYYRFGASWPHVRETLLVIQEQDGDPLL
jgi:hypothetical protein